MWGGEDMKRAAMFLALAAMLLLMGPLAYAADQELIVESPTDGGTISGGVVVVKFDVKNFRIVDFTKDTAVSEGKGHIHIQLDDNPYSTIHTASNVFVYAGVKPGRHKLRLQLVHSDHTPVKTGVEKTVEFTVAEK
jgi:uncharacterized protein DUF6130